MAGTPSGFEYSMLGDDVVIRHRGQLATTLRGVQAQQFLTGVANGDPQELMARVTGNYNRGDERVAKNHPRNR